MKININNEIEIWKDIDGYEDIYQISTFGRVKRLAGIVHNGYRSGFEEEKMMKLSFDKDGYHILGLSKNGKHKMLRVHQLVLKAFVPNPEGKPIGNHIDGNKTNNHVNNLCWSTVAENNDHAYEIGLKTNNKYVAKYSLNGSLIDLYYSIREAARENNIPSGYVSNAVSIRAKTMNGFIWEIVSKEFFENNGGSRRPVDPNYTKQRKTEKCYIKGRNGYGK